MTIIIFYILILFTMFLTRIVFIQRKNLSISGYSETSFSFLKNVEKDIGKQGTLYVLENCLALLYVIMLFYFFGFVKHVLLLDFFQYPDKFLDKIDVLNFTFGISNFITGLRFLKIKKKNQGKWHIPTIFSLLTGSLTFLVIGIRSF